jgi:hypothetical protein
MPPRAVGLSAPAPQAFILEFDLYSKFARDTDATEVCVYAHPTRARAGRAHARADTASEVPRSFHDARRLPAELICGDSSLERNTVAAGTARWLAPSGWLQVGDSQLPPEAARRQLWEALGSRRAQSCIP